ncbi:MAG TPA: PQQ-binding-like beta-propeller repeat protein, partial [archaeon]|nr:PQQ-binding-like beta-propeller repeat protein [archaeon]
NDDNVYCLNAANGRSIWNYTTGNWVDSSPAIYNGVVYVGSFDSIVYAFGTRPTISPTSSTPITTGTSNSDYFKTTSPAVYLLLDTTVVVVLIIVGYLASKIRPKTSKKEAPPSKSSTSKSS